MVPEIRRKSTDDRYRGIFGRRDIVVVSPEDLALQGLVSRDPVDILAAFDDIGARIVRSFTAVARTLPRGCIAAYYPEINGLVALDDHDLRSGTWAYKSAPVRLRAASAPPTTPYRLGKTS